MPNSRHKWLICSPSSRRATKRRRSSITELAFHGIATFPMQLHGEGVTHVSGTKCHLCLGPLIRDYRFMHDFSMLGRSGQANPKLPRQDFDTLARVPVVMHRGRTLVEKFNRK